MRCIGAFERCACATIGAAAGSDVFRPGRGGHGRRPAAKHPRPSSMHSSSAASWRTVSCACAATTAATTSWSLTATSGVGSASHAARGACRRPQRIWSTTSSRMCRCASGYRHCRSRPRQAQSVHRTVGVRARRLHLIRCHGVLAPSLPHFGQAAGAGGAGTVAGGHRQAQPAATESGCAQHRPVRRRRHRRAGAS